MLVVVEDMARRTRCSPILSWPCRAHQNVESTASGPVQSPVLDGRHALLRRGPSAGHGGRLRPLWYHLIALVVATDAPLISREAWATLQEWAVCSSIFVVGRGVKAGLPGSTPRDTLNARSERVARVAQAEWSQDRLYLRRVKRRRAGCAAATALSGRRRRAHTSREKTATAAQSRRRPRGVHAIVSTRRWSSRALGGACSSMQVAEQWARC